LLPNLIILPPQKNKILGKLSQRYKKKDIPTILGMTKEAIIDKIIIKEEILGILLRQKVNQDRSPITILEVKIRSVQNKTEIKIETIIDLLIKDKTIQEISKSQIFRKNVQMSRIKILLLQKYRFLN